ncbi:hypothetical protein C8F01DRAFT_1370223 [Mycena amicta]|nr:hypothetical protein C8F01DRAFT_1370223 [Mycena amicta]
MSYTPRPSSSSSPTTNPPTRIPSPAAPAPPPVYSAPLRPFHYPHRLGRPRIYDATVLVHENEDHRLLSPDARPPAIRVRRVLLMVGVGVGWLLSGGEFSGRPFAFHLGLAAVLGGSWLLERHIGVNWDSTTLLHLWTKRPFFYLPDLPNPSRGYLVVVSVRFPVHSGGLSLCWIGGVATRLGVWPTRAFFALGDDSFVSTVSQRHLTVPLCSYNDVSAFLRDVIDLSTRSSSPIRVLVPPPPSSAPTPHVWLRTDFACRSSMQTVPRHRMDLSWTREDVGRGAGNGCVLSAQSQCLSRSASGSAGRHSGFRFAGLITASSSSARLSTYAQCYINHYSVYNSLPALFTPIHTTINTTIHPLQTTMICSTRAVVPPNGFLPYGGRSVAIAAASTPPVSALRRLSAVDLIVEIVPVLRTTKAEPLRRQRASPNEGIGGSTFVPSTSPPRYQLRLRVFLRLGGAGEVVASGRSTHVPSTSPPG